jgi:hypothetical protein
LVGKRINGHEKGNGKTRNMGRLIPTSDRNPPQSSRNPFMWIKRQTQIEKHG